MDALISATSGGVAAVCSCVALYPVDVILVRYQTRLKEVGGRSGEIFDVVRDALQRGAPSLYRGVDIKMLEALVRNFVYFYWYQFLKGTYERKIGRLNTSANLIMASLAAVLNQCMTAPLEVVTTNLQTSDYTLIPLIANIYKKQGLRGFYRGFLASIVLCSNPAITNAAFDRLKFAVQVVMLVRFQRFRQYKDVFPGGEEEAKRAARTLGLTAIPAIVHSLLTNTTVPSAPGSLPAPATSAAMTPSQLDEELPELTAFQSFIFGALAKALATIVTYPYIRAKVLMQHRSGQRACRDPQSTKGSDPNLVSSSNGSQEVSPQNHDRRPESGRDGVESESADSSANRLGVPPRHHQAPAFNVPHSDSDAGLPFQRFVNPPTPSEFLRDVDTYSVASFCLSEGERDIGDREEYLQAPGPLRLQHMNRNPSSGIVAEEGDGVVNVLVSVIMQEGVIGMYKGLLLQLVKTVLASALLYMIKEKLHRATAKVLRALLRCFMVLFQSKRGGQGHMRAKIGP
ncbi:unnamed protein product [Vitrella brassicaformis CCMP3155]|uniref:Uncharacterized protein n=1 Tax=Vitrella brassicaformis (strain CCMP3155) TaxID=1169540 RepID=A0A0G4EQ32_VITBC|nr:unnamed protein product [Vitrella brassicaformis CCMP3155]|eukprot:CEL99534.1 unnamed protein product [Vitrella brassicaformis CCMP3155]